MLSCYKQGAMYRILSTGPPRKSELNRILDTVSATTLTPEHRIATVYLSRRRRSCRSLSACAARLSTITLLPCYLVIVLTLIIPSSTVSHMYFKRTFREEASPVAPSLPAPLVAVVRPRGARIRVVAAIAGFRFPGSSKGLALYNTCRLRY